MASQPGSVQRQSLLKRALRGALILTLLLFATLGIVAVAFEIYSWHAGTPWSPNDINALLAAESPARRFAKVVWDDVKFLIQYGSYLIAALAFAVAITQIKTVAKLISDFIVARGPIYALGTTITQVEASVSVLSNTVDRLSKLEPTIKEIAEKIEGTYAQIASLQRLAVSERTGASVDDGSTQPPNGQMEPPSPSPAEDRNWERLRELWNANGERLDEVIERIPEKRRRAKFQRMPRTNYPAIINALGDVGLISEAARKASLDLHSTFMSYKPRNRKIPDAAVAAMEVLDRMLDHELRPPSDDEPRPPVDTDAAAPP